MGALAKLSILVRIAGHIETWVLYQVPMYRMLKVFSSSLVKPERSDVRLAIVNDDAGGGDPCYVTEHHESGMATVLLPWSLASFAGSIKVVPVSKLAYLDCSVDEYSRPIGLMGVGVEERMTMHADNDQT